MLGLQSGAGLRDRHGRPLLISDHQALEREAGAPVVVAPRPWLHGLLACRRSDDPALGGAGLVVAADGAGSRLRAALFPQHPSLAGSGEHAVRAIAPVEQLHPHARPRCNARPGA